MADNLTNECVCRYIISWVLFERAPEFLDLHLDENLITRVIIIIREFEKVKKLDFLLNMCRKNDIYFYDDFKHLLFFSNYFLTRSLKEIKNVVNTIMQQTYCELSAGSSLIVLSMA